MCMAAAAAAAMSILRDRSGAEPWREMNRVEQASGMGGRAALCGGLYGLEAEVEVGPTRALSTRTVAYQAVPRGQ
jgi:hypothetical protein